MTGLDQEQVDWLYEQLDAMILRGEITNAAAVGGLLSAAQARDDGWATLRPPDTPLP